MGKHTGYQRKRPVCFLCEKANECYTNLRLNKRPEKHIIRMLSESLNSCQLKVRPIQFGNE